MVRLGSFNLCAGDVLAVFQTRVLQQLSRLGRRVDGVDTDTTVDVPVDELDNIMTISLVVDFK